MTVRDFNEEKYKEWKARVNVRDNFICQECGREGNHAHHIKSWLDYKELRYDIDNGETLCLICHNKKHRVKFTKKLLKKRMNFSISFNSSEKLKAISFKRRISMSKIIDDFIESLPE